MATTETRPAAPDRNSAPGRPPTRVDPEVALPAVLDPMPPHAGTRAVVE